MRTVKFFTMAVLALGLAAGLGMFRAAEDAKPKYTIEEVMEKGHSGKQKSLYNQVKIGKASKEQKQQLLELYEELAKNEAPKTDNGSAADWTKRTSALVKAAKDVVADKEGAIKELTKAANCKACHDIYKE